MAEGEQYRPGVIVFDLYVDWWIWEGEIDSPREIKGAYFAEVISNGTLTLLLSDGDVLHRYQGVMPLEDYYLWQDLD